MSETPRDPLGAPSAAAEASEDAAFVGAVPVRLVVEPSVAGSGTVSGQAAPAATPAVPSSGALVADPDEGITELRADWRADLEPEVQAELRGDAPESFDFLKESALASGTDALSGTVAPSGTDTSFGTDTSSGTDTSFGTDASSVAATDAVAECAASETVASEAPVSEIAPDESVAKDAALADAALADAALADAASEGAAPSSPWPPVQAAGGGDNGQVPANPGVILPDANAGDDPDRAEDESPKDDDGEKPMTLMDHLGELRTRLVRCLLGASVGFLLCYGVAEQLFLWLAQPLAAVMPQDTRLIYTSVPEGFFVYLKVAFVAGMFLASPYIFYQIWAFVAPGLYREERRQILPLSFCSAMFFIMGASFCYFVVFPFAFEFFMSYSTGMIVAMPSMDEYLSFTLKMLIAFGLIFEMPLFAFFLARMGIITAAWMRKVRRYAILAVFVVAAILTPPDVFSQMLMAMPMLLLYEISIFVAASVGRKEKPAAADADTAGGTANDSTGDAA